MKGYQSNVVTFANSWGSKLRWDKCYTVFCIFQIYILKRGNRSSFQNPESPEFCASVCLIQLQDLERPKVSSVLPLQAICFPPLRKVSGILLAPTSSVNLTGQQPCSLENFPSIYCVLNLRKFRIALGTKTSLMLSSHIPQIPFAFDVAQSRVWEGLSQDYIPGLLRAGAWYSWPLMTFPLGLVSCREST